MRENMKSHKSQVTSHKSPFDGVHPERSREAQGRQVTSHKSKYGGFKKPVTGFTLMEIVVVAGILSLAMGVMLTFLITSRTAADFSQARLAAVEYAQRAMDQIARELRYSGASHVRISHALGWTLESRPGQVINFQIPVGIYGALNLTSSNWLKWGNQDTEGYYIAYSVNADSQLLRSTYLAANATGAASRIVAPHISSISFNRTDGNSDLVHVVVISRITSPRETTATLEADVKMRN